MSLLEIFRAIYINICESKFKVFLTSLGIIVGSLTIILVIGIGTGSQANVEDQFKQLNAGTINIMPSFGKNTSSNLTLENLQYIKDNCPSIRGATIMGSGKADISYNTTSYSASIAGATEDFMEINNLEIEYGEFINNYHNEKRKKVAVIGAEIAELFFEGEVENAIGENITIKGRRYEIIGVLKRLGDSMPDEEVILPYDVAEKYIFGKKAKTRVVVLAKDIQNVSFAIEEIQEALYDLYKEESENFMVRDAGSRLETAKDSARSMSLLLMAVATIVLIVGGIGIMNVLFVSVKERTKEIGILKAIGARRKDILLQFLLEAVVISIAGGIVGIILSFAIMPLMKYLDLRVIPTFYGYIMALSFSIATGTFFGYYPASKAASLRPIEALNYE